MSDSTGTKGRQAGDGPLLLATKLYPPRWRADYVARPRLQRRFADSKLTLISAPPGFGKTTLLAEWLATIRAEEQGVAWVSLDTHENDPATFWTYVFSTLQGAGPDVGRAALAALAASKQARIEPLLAGALNEIAALPRRVVLVLDDFHVIEASAIHDSVSFLLANMPPQMQLVIASRADPAVPIARLRGRGELVEIRAADLRFTGDEATSFLNGANGLDLSAENVAALESRTEGWIAALQLAALSMKDRDDASSFIAAFSGDDRYIVDYLVEEVLERLPARTREFLLQTSILDQLSAPLCDAVTGTTNARGLLESLERDNLFLVPLDDRRQWYRYHHLFADVLQSHLRAEQASELPALHRRASAWFADQGQPDRAIRHALAAEDFPWAAGLIELQAEKAMRGHQPDRLIASATDRPASFRNTLMSEWTKLATIRSTHLTLGTGFLLSVVTTALVTLAVGTVDADWPDEFDPITISMVGNIFALIVYSVFGVLAVTREFSNGMIRLTLVATPSRTRVLMAKLLVVGGITFVLGLVTTISMFYIGQAVLGATGMPTASLADGDAQRMVLGLGAVMPFFPLAGLAMGVTLRSSAGGITAVLGLLWLPQIVGEFLPLWWRENVVSLLPGTALDSMTVSHLHPTPGFIDPALAAMVVAAWLLVRGAAGFALFLRRDA